jgi:PAS domain S-box-containing protein
MKKRNTSIQRKLMSVVLITSSVALLLISASYIAYEFFTFRETVLNQLITEGRIIASNSTAAIAFESEGDAHEILSALKAEKNIVAACLYDNKGKLFATYSTRSFKDSFPAAPQSEGHAINGFYLETFIPVLQKHTMLGTLYLKLDMAPYYTRFAWYVLIAFVFGSITLLLAFYFTRRLQKNISAPILELAAKSKLVSEKYDYSVRAKKMSDDELGLLTDAFNQMLTQIQIQNIQIASFNRELEIKVKERTQQLNKSNEELQMQNEFVQTILDSSMALMAVYDKETRILSFNNACENFYHLKKENVLGKTYDEAFPHAKNNPFIADLQKALQGEFIHVERFKSPITNRYLENFLVPLRDANNNVYAVFTTGHDITSIVEGEEQLKNINAALTKSNRDLEQFAYVASHDLQEPLRKIQVYAQVIEKSQTVDEATQKHFDKIRNAAQRMTELIRAVLEYSRLSRKDKEFKLIDLNEVLENVKNDFELLIAEKNATITSDELPCINGIPLQLNQLFSNLINNSLKFSLKEPVIKISCSTVAAGKILIEGIKPYAEYFKLKFADNGIGFEPQNAERIFSIFQRLHAKEEYSGTGIGLAVCKKIVENHEGFIDAYSEAGQGAEFTIYLPNEHS